MNDTGENPEKKRSRFGEFASEHKIFSGLAGTLLLLLVTVVIATDGQDSTGSQPTVSTESQQPDPQQEVETGEGEGESAEPDRQGPSRIGLIARAEEREDESFSTENTYVEQIAVEGILDPGGIHMQMDDFSHSGAITVAVNREFRWLQGQVGIASEPCSAGSVAYAAVRDSDGRPLWPENGDLEAVRREARQFKVDIAAEDSVVLYAEAPEAEAGYCGVVYDYTSVGWVNTELIAE